MPQISIQQLFDETHEGLQLAWNAPRYGGSRQVVSAAGHDGLSLIGHLNLVNPNQIQVLGPAEMEYLSALPVVALRQTMKSLFAESLSAVVVVGGAPLPGILVRRIRTHQVALLTTPLPGAQVIDTLRHHLVLTLAAMTNLHGVFMEVQGVGVLITGSSAIGKSELALELISRGHRLIADDIVDLFQIAPGTIEGRCPPLLQDFLEVRGLGIVNVRALFGETAVRPRKNLRLIVHLQHLSEISPESADRLAMTATSQEILGVEVPKVRIPVAAGTNIAVLLEVAVRNFILRLRGINSTQDFIERQQQEIARNAEPPDRE